MFFREMSSSTNCAPKQATIAGVYDPAAHSSMHLIRHLILAIVGTYFWADETHSTGDYSFYAHAI